MEKNDVKRTCGGTMFEIKIEKNEKILFKKLTRC